ncbi:hypothetical protein [Actinoplanes sp. URMC 104]|uniref:hypothetical protein n=1 Tax=Actinoplanes sp. URMC 104 TaxID=3423409 RepID=UPI003F1C70BE
MTDEHHALTNEQAADILRNDPVLSAGSAGGQDDEDRGAEPNDQGTDDDATTPDRAVTEQD